ncbi:MAG: ABC transporter [Candidatus Omnitrophica bacterium CG11_big_fil_rev_8_21_14_0_20_64_10]|nr:MAG: ABC transporter [Candidatus Omnitrophica bacterium CG11_big_fil_rev_8_21_14_0_20_64_10]
MTAPAIDIQDLWVSIDQTPVLEGVHLRVAPGDFLGIIGPNGAGKSILLKTLLGRVRPDRGSVRVFGKPPEHARGRVAYLPQRPEFDLKFPITAREVVQMGRLRAGRWLKPLTPDDRRRAEKALAQVRMTEHAGRQIAELSQGQLQRVLIARALAVEAPLLLLDEPTSALDPGAGSELYGLLEKLQPKVTIVLVSHEIGVISQVVRSVACLNRRLHYHGSKQITREMIEDTYGDTVDFIMHRHIHRILEPPEGPGR